MSHIPETIQLIRQRYAPEKTVDQLQFEANAMLRLMQSDLIDTVSQNSDDGEVLLGDIVLAHGVCTAEAAERGISVADHATHLIVHGTLHLLGYDHINDDEGDAMEAIERDALASLGIADPYIIRED